MSDTVVDMLDCTGYIVREYANENTGETVNVAVVVGPTVPISLHTPEICYSSRDYTIHRAKQRVTIRGPDGSDNEFWSLTLRANDLAADMLRVYYAWSSGGRWSAPEWHRFMFPNSRHLYKLQLACYLPPGTDQETGDLCREFLQDFLPAVEQCLVEPSD